MSDDPETQRLRGELDRAYSQLGEITSRLLAVNEAGELLSSTHRQDAVAAALLEVSGRSVAAREGAVFLVRGEGAFTLLASIGLDPGATEALEQSLPDLAACQLAEVEKRTFTRAEARAAESFTEWAEEARSADAAAAVEPQLDLFVPVAIEGRVLAVLALGARARGGAWTDDERALLEHLAGQGALALDRALLFGQVQDRLADLDALVRISREVTSTLDLDRVLSSAVNTTAAIVQRERAVLALDDGHGLTVRAVSDFPRVDSGTAERLGLRKLLAWLALKRPEAFAVSASEVDRDPAIVGREVLLDYFSREMRSLLVIPLKDDQGLVGYLLLESYREDSFAAAVDRDTLAVLAGQLSVAIRNAELYRHLPMVGALAPLAERRRRWKRLTPAQRQRWMAGGAVALVAIALIPWPRAVAGDARLLAAMQFPVRTAVAGFLRAIEVQPGQRVAAGQLLARLEEVSGSARIAELRAQAAQARGQSARAGQEQDAFERRMAELRREEAVAQMAAAERQGGDAQLVAPVDGYVLTPALEDREGSYLPAGAVFCEVSPLDSLRVEVAVSEIEIDGVHPGAPLRVKVLGFPDRQFRGRVTEVSWQGEAGSRGEPSVFLVRGWVANGNLLLRSGMTGRARIDVTPSTLLDRWTRGLFRAFRLAFWW